MYCLYKIQVNLMASLNFDRFLINQMFTCTKHNQTKECIIHPDPDQCSHLDFRWIRELTSLLTERNELDKNIPVTRNISISKKMYFKIKSILGELKLLYKKDLHDPENHDGVITHLQPDILECEVKWALGSYKQSQWR